MRICYLDEAGDTAPLASAASALPPVFVPAAIVIEQGRLAAATVEYLRIKQRYFPNLMPKTGHYLDCVMAEVKGSEVRRVLRTGNRNERRHALGFLDRVVELLEQQRIKIIGRVWVKAVGQPMNPTAIYTSSVQAVFRYFQHYLTQQDDVGLVIADSRRKAQNSEVAHSIFTQKFGVGGDQYDRILEMPTYGHSENHVGLQLADLLVSGFVFPMATFTYCTGHIHSVHVSPRFVVLKTRYGVRLRRLQYWYTDCGRPRGGITVSDGIAQRSGADLWK